MTPTATPFISPPDGPIIIFRATREACNVCYCNFTGDRAHRVSVS